MLIENPYKVFWHAECSEGGRGCEVVLFVIQRVRCSYREGSIRLGEPTSFLDDNVTLAVNFHQAPFVALDIDQNGYEIGWDMDRYETEEYYNTDLEYAVERRRRTRRLRLVAAIVTVALLALTILSTTFNVINIPSNPTPATEPVFVASSALN